MNKYTVMITEAQATYIRRCVCTFFAETIQELHKTIIETKEVIDYQIIKKEKVNVLIVND